MLLNALNQNFVISIPYNWIYPDVADNWKPVLDRLYLNYNTCEDFINSQITSINFPGVSTSPVSQQTHLYNIQKRPGQQMDQIAQQQLTLTMKTTESYISYFLMRNQFERFLRLVDVAPLYLPPITVSLLNDGGYETVSYVYKQVTMTSISDLNLSYAATLGNFNTFSASFVYNYYDVYMTDSSGKRIIVATDVDTQLDFEQEHLDPENPKYKSRQNAMTPVSPKRSLAEVEKQQMRAAKVTSDSHIPDQVARAENLHIMKSLSKNVGERGTIQSSISQKR